MLSVRFANGSTTEELIFYLSSSVNWVLVNELSEKTTFWKSHRNHAELIFVGFVLGLIFAHLFIFHPFACPLQSFLLGRTVFWEFLSQNAVHAGCSSRCLPFRQSLSPACACVHTSSYFNTANCPKCLQDQLPLKHEVYQKPRELALLLPNGLITAYSF